jgi:hypothetical protein
MDLNHDTGGTVEGWPEVTQSIHTVLGTLINSRRFRREFGSVVLTLIDAPMNAQGVLALHVAVAEALERWEPRFELENVQIEGAATGAITMVLSGTYRPKAHLGDVGSAVNETQTVRVYLDRAETWRQAA